MLEQTLLSVFPQFQSIFNDSEKNLFNEKHCVEIPANTTLFRQGDQCQNYYLVLDGSIRVFARAENGREIVLYRISRGGSCVLTTSCLMGNQRYPAEGVTETQVTALSIPGKDILTAIDHSATVREFVFTSHSERLASLIAFVSEVVFSRIDVRLAKHLLETQQQNPNDSPLKITHQQLAMELGSAREVISRQLKEFERKNLIQLRRGEIHISDPEGLCNISHES